ncbi:uncharacterized protein ACR2FA_007507 [Aphomia sociella]
MSKSNNLLFMELFIQNVRSHPCLWDTNNISFRDLTRKGLTWELVAQECEMTNGDEAKSQWKRLTDCHREALRRRESSSGQQSRLFSPWKYEQLMDFLLPQYENRHNITNFSLDPVLGNDGNMEVLSHQTFMESNMRHDDVDGREKRREQRQTERDESRKQVVETNRFSNDGLTDLFASLCQKTRELPTSIKLRVQREVFELVSRAEEEAFSLEQSLNHTNTPQSSPSSYECSNTEHSSNIVISGDKVGERAFAFFST